MVDFLSVLLKFLFQIIYGLYNTETINLSYTFDTMLQLCKYFEFVAFIWVAFLRGWAESEWNSSDVVALSFTSASEDNCLVVFFLLPDFSVDKRFSVYKY